MAGLGLGHQAAKSGKVSEIEVWYKEVWDSGWQKA